MNMKEAKEKLKKEFDEIFIHEGSENDTINMEYTFDLEDVIYTDGFIMTSNISYNHIIKDMAEKRYSTETAIRGGSYIIDGDRNVKRYTLYVNEDKIEEKYDEIIINLKRMKENINSIDYYMNTWRDKSACNDIGINDF